MVSIFQSHLHKKIHPAVSQWIEPFQLNYDDKQEEREDDDDDDATNVNNIE